jgi:hypothetical protein
MGVISIVILGLAVFVGVMILLKARQVDEEQRRQRFCDSASHHSLQFHAYDGKGALLHHCQCHYKVRYGKQERWCRVCADAELERQARKEFLREKTRVYGTNN